MSHLFLVVSWLGICEDWLYTEFWEIRVLSSPPPPPPSLPRGCVSVPSQNSLFNARDSYLKPVRA